MARKLQPAVIFFDEIDSLLSSRKENEHEASRRIKTEFMVQVDGAGSSEGGGAVQDRVLVMGATNIPWELDEAVLRRLVKRVYVPLPDAVARAALINHLLLKQQPGDTGSGSGSGSSSSTQGNGPQADLISGFVAGVANVFSKLSPLSAADMQTLLAPKEMEEVVKRTEGYSGSDLTAVCHEAAMGPIRELTPEQLQTIKSADIRGISEKDYIDALKVIRPSVTASNLAQFVDWASQYGTVL